VIENLSKYTSAKSYQKLIAVWQRYCIWYNRNRVCRLFLDLCEFYNTVQENTSNAIHSNYDILSRTCINENSRLQ